MTDAISSLLERGYIVRISRGNSKGKSAVYDLNWNKVQDSAPNDVQVSASSCAGSPQKVVQVPATHSRNESIKDSNVGGRAARCAPGGASAPPTDDNTPTEVPYGNGAARQGSRDSERRMSKISDLGVGETVKSGSRTETKTRHLKRES